MAGTVNAGTPRLGALRARRLAAAALCAALAGCASTDELYAEYDAGLCPVVPMSAAAGPAGPERIVERVRYVERGSGDEVRWPPAIYFGYDSDALDRWALAELVEAVRLLERHPDLNVMLTGYTSRLGSRDYNAKLAVRRVMRIVDHLAGAGIERSRVLAMPVGMGLPDFTSDVRVANAVNRRVGLTLLDVAGRPISPDYMMPTLEAARRRVGPSWPPNETGIDGRPGAANATRPAAAAATPPLVVPVEAPATPPVDPIPGPVDPWAAGGAGEIGPRAAPAGGRGGGRGSGDVR